MHIGLIAHYQLFLSDFSEYEIWSLIIPIIRDDDHARISP